jgi:hypothetical protein
MRNMKNSIMKGEFKEKDKIKCLLWCDRHCCLCGISCGNNIEIAHIKPKGDSGSDNINNSIPLCFNCHGEIGRYNDTHPKGIKYRQTELKARRDQIYDKYTQHLVPPIWFNLKKSIFPDVGIEIIHKGTSHPVRVSVAVQIILGCKDKGLVPQDQYNGNRLWNLNPLFSVYGHFPIPDDIAESTEEIEIRVSATVIDQCKLLIGAYAISY